MPNRIIKESICENDQIDQLTLFEETCFYRLIVNVDDYGRCDARPSFLRSRLFPLREIPPQQIEAALNRLQAVGLIGRYQVDDRSYLFLPGWFRNQCLRRKRIKYPPPPGWQDGESPADGDAHASPDDRTPPDHRDDCPEAQNPGKPAAHSIDWMPPRENGNAEIIGKQSGANENAGAEAKAPKFCNPEADFSEIIEPQVAADGVSHGSLPIDTDKPAAEPSAPQMADSLPQFADHLPQVAGSLPPIFANGRHNPIQSESESEDESKSQSEDESGIQEESLKKESQEIYNDSWKFSPRARAATANILAQRFCREHLPCAQLRDLFVVIEHALALGVDPESITRSARQLSPAEFAATYLSIGR